MKKLILVIAILTLLISASCTRIADENRPTRNGNVTILSYNGDTLKTYHNVKIAYLDYNRVWITDEHTNVVVSGGIVFYE